jgi:hypothetical protein
MLGKRRDSRFCSPPCRAEASRISRLLSGRTVDGYRTLADRQAAGEEAHTLSLEPT